MTKPVFNNVPNEHLVVKIETENGRYCKDIWISRAVAVVGVIFAIPMVGQLQVLITKRSKTMRDEPLKYGLPCGYIDFSETTHDAMIREVYEETSLYLPDYQYFNIGDYHKKPIIIHDSPKDNRQNISLIFATILNFSGNEDKFPQEIEKFTCRETAEVKWMSVSEFYNNFDNSYEWAFGHNQTIKDVLKNYSNI